MSVPATTPGLEARSVTVEIGGNRILDDVSLRVAPGEVVALVGPNGAGKSTLLGALTGDVVPTSGTVELHGRPTGSYRAREAARERAVLLQKYAIAFGFPVHHVVEMGRSPWFGTDRSDDDELVVRRSMRQADVLHLAERSFPTLSGGEQARTSFARVLAQETPVVLLDEPTAALDIRHQEALLATTREAARAGAAVVVVLHDLTLAAAYADRICVLARGRVAADGPPREVLTEDLLTVVYQHPVRVIDLDGSPLVVPLRARPGETDDVLEREAR